MAELAVVSVRKAKMQKYLEEGNENAQIVFDLLEDPNEFLSTVQIGISLIGVLTGAFGGVTLAEPLSKLISFLTMSSVFVVVILLFTEDAADSHTHHSAGSHHGNRPP